MYILFTPEMNIDNILSALHNKGLKDSHYGPDKEHAIGVCTTFVTKHYTFLCEPMLSKNPHVSWIHCRKKYETEEEFINAVNNETF
jgi:hypothetical protein